MYQLFMQITYYGQLILKSILYSKNAQHIEIQFNVLFSTNRAA